MTLYGVDVAAWPFPLGWLYLNVLGNLIASLIWAVPTVWVLYRKWTCNLPHCARVAHVPVSGTTFHSCRRHATAEHHATLTQRHAARHPEAHAFLNGPQ
jgi:hypothetical protein